MIDLVIADGKVAPGSCYLRNTPVLAPHDGSQPDLFLSWTAIDVAARSVDVVLYFHGFALGGQRQALLSDFVEVSGLDLREGGESLADRRRPTVAIVPRGHASPAGSPTRPWPYHFPALFDGGADTLISDALEALASARKQESGLADVGLQRDRLILMGHSGGGKGVVGTLPGLGTPADEIYLFDALYEDPSPALADWVATAIREYPAKDRRMWVGYLEDTPTALVSEAVQAACANAIAATPAAKQAGLRKSLVVQKAEGGHMGVPRRYARGLLATGDAAANA